MSVILALIIHTVHNGHKFLQTSHRFLFTAFAHKITSKTRDHTLQKKRKKKLIIYKNFHQFIPPTKKKKKIQLFRRTSLKTFQKLSTKFFILLSQQFEMVFLILQLFDLFKGNQIWHKVIFIECQVRIKIILSRLLIKSLLKQGIIPYKRKKTPIV